MLNFFNQVPEISIDQLEEVLKGSVKLIDVRTPEEYRAGHIVKAVNFPLAQIERYEGQKEPLYLICQSGMRSKQAAKILQTKGYQVINVRGGMNQWTGRKEGGRSLKIKQPSNS